MNFLSKNIGILLFLVVGITSALEAKSLFKSHCKSHSSHGKGGLSAGARIINNKNLAKEKTDFFPPEWVLDNNIMYEMNILRTPSMDPSLPGGTFKAAETNLPRLKSLGITIIWLMPIFEIGDGAIAINDKADTASLYSTIDYFSPKASTGTIKDVKRFIRRAHELGIRVILDIAHNQTSFANPLLQSHPEFFSRNNRGEVVNGAASALGGFFWDAANFDEPAATKKLQNYVISILTFWIRKVDCDGFRFDGGLGQWPNEFWNRARIKTGKLKDVFFFGESTYPGQGVTASRVFDGEYGWRVFNVLTSSHPTIESLIEAVGLDLLQNSVGCVRTNYSANHDTVFFKTPAQIYGAQYFNELVLRYTMPNYMPQIVQGEDGGNLGRINLFDNTIIDNDFNSTTTQLLQKLARLRKKNPCLHNVTQRDGFYSFYLSELDGQVGQGVFGFVRWESKSNNRVLVLVNLSDQDIVYNPDPSSTFYNRDIWFASSLARDVLPAGIYTNAFFDPSLPASSINDPSILVSTNPRFGVPAFTTIVGANSFKVYITDAVYEDIPFGVDDQPLFNRWNYMAVYPELPSLFEIAAKPQENIGGFLAQLQAHRSEIEALLKNNEAVTFFAPRGNTLPPGFNLFDFIVAGRKTYDPESALAFFDDPASALGVPKSFDEFETGIPRLALSGNSITLLTPIPAYFLAFVPTYEINGVEYEIASDNITFVYTDSQGIQRQGLLNIIQKK